MIGNLLQHDLEELIHDKKWDELREVLCGLDAAGQDRLVADLEALIGRHNVAGDGTMVVPAEYLEVVAVRR